jgi:hypothetical protein
MAVDRANEVLSSAKIKVPKAHLLRVLRQRNSNGEELAHFWSVPIQTGGGKGLCIVDRGDFNEELLAAVKAQPPTRRAGNMPVLTPDNIRPPGGL